MKNLLIFVLSLLSLSVYGQKDKIIGLSYNSFGAVQSFRDNISHNPKGVSLNFLWATDNNKFQYGLEYGVAMYSSKEYEYELVEEGRAGEYINIYEEDCFMKYHVVGRYLPYRSKLAATYLEGRLGLSTFFSSRTAMEETSYYDDSFEFHGTAFNSALGAGTLINLSYLFTRQAWYAPVLLDVGVTFNTGSSTTYRNMREGEQVQSLSEGQYHSSTHAMNFKMGLAVKLFDGIE